MTNNHAPCTLLQGIAFQAEGDANFYRLMRGGNWLARVQFNGELLVWDQEQLLTAMLQGDDNSTSGNKYRAELYDEVWQKARDAGYGNVTMALAALDELKRAQQPQQRVGLARGAEAAPVGEREAFETWWRVAGLNDGFISYWSREAFQAGAAHQRQSGVVVPHDLLIRVLEPVTSEQYINSKHELLALMDEFASLNKGAGSHE